MGGVRFPGPLWRRNTGGVDHPMTFAETLRSRPGWTPVSDSDAFDWIGEFPIRTAGKKNKPLR
ncbi:hypothetical protein C8P69_105432 [Phreatobacter oligotrophus]|jgi:hypothetical protein|uniref:Uncharacterized protein n=1 Tax=Phreatobacter oligotrophus TaxID=1122261 RepID=A0A2T4Z3C5_9HYPH|nr:hypothetical protein C8P69_105432 [Phreatobacter oligotrophus]